MIASKEVVRQEKSRIRLSVTVKKEEAVKEYDKLVTEYAKKAHIKGFRPGKVPVAILERKFGDSLKLEATQNLIEESLKEVFAQIDEKPLPYATPELEEGLEYAFDRDLAFSVSYDVFPEVKLGEYRKLEISEPQVKITDEDEKRELDALVEQNSFVVEKSAAAAKNDILTVNYWELDHQGSAIPSSRRQDFSFTLGSGYNLYRFDDELIGVLKGETKTITKTFPADYEVKDLAGTTKTIAVEVTAVKEKKLPALDDELAQDISDKYKTLSDLKKDIRSRLEQTLSARLRQRRIDSLMDAVAANSSVDLPESMIAAELETSWRQFVAQFRAKEEAVIAMLRGQGKSRDELLESWRPKAEKSLKIRLLIETMLDREKIEASDEELDAYFDEQAEGSSMSAEELEDYYTKNRLLDMARHDLREKKLFDLVLGDTKIKKGEKLKFVDVIRGNQ